MRMDASWSGVLMDPPDTRLRRESPRAPTASSPRTRHPDHNERAAVLGSIKARPGNDGACGQHRATAGLDSPCARRLPTRVGRGEETGFQVEQRNRDEGSGECRQIVLDFEGLIQGPLGLHSRYGPPGCSTAQGGLCHEASIRQLPRQTARQLPDLSTIIWVDSSSTGYPCLFGAHQLSGDKLPYIAIEHDS
jgi:hypothetical protein